MESLTRDSGDRRSKLFTLSLWRHSKDQNHIAREYRIKQYLTAWGVLDRYRRILRLFIFLCFCDMSYIL